MLLATIDIWWASLQPQVQAAVVGGAFTLASIVGSALVVSYQLRRQAENTAVSNLHSEKLKLKKEIYQEILDACSEVITSVSVLNAYVLGFYGYCARQKEVVEVAEMAPSPPTQRYQEFATLQQDVNEKLLTIIRVISRWEITEPRLRVFKFAMNAAAFELEVARKRYHLGTASVLPFDEDVLKKFGWKPPNDQELDRLSHTTDDVRRAAEYAHYWTIDLQAQAQNVFLGEMFGTKVMPRPSAPTHSPVVITLERHEDLVQYLLKETAWGKDLQPRLVEGKS